jgi:AcrR family transcriptional regulator
MPVATLVAALGAPSGDRTTERILDTAYDQILTFGFRRLSVEEVARRAGIARITIYRRFSSKEELVRAVLVREARRIFDTVDAKVASFADAEDQLVEGFVAILTAVRDHPLVQRILATEPDLALSALKSHGAVAIALARGYLAEHLRRAQGRGALGRFEPEPIAEILVRLCATFVVIPESCVALDTEADARTFARRYLLPALGPPPDRGAKKR